MYIIRSVSARAAAALLIVALTAAGGCRGPFAREYEYEEQLYLDIRGSATLIVDASVASLIALRGLPLDPSPRALLDTSRVRQLYEAGGCRVTRIGQPWYRHGRRFVQIQVRVDDVRTLGSCGPLAWSTYRFDHKAGEVWFEQLVGPPASGDPKVVNWTGQELIAFKLHLPSRITFHNVRRLADNAPGEVERGNILTWEQRLTDRRAGIPVDIQVHMEEKSILYRTLWMFAGSFVAAVLVLMALIWRAVRKGRRQLRAGARELHEPRRRA